MTDPQTPATEAGRLAEMRRFHNGRHQATDFCDACAIVAMLPAIEAEARAGWVPYGEEYDWGRADALREAADAVEHLEPTKHTIEVARSGLWGWNDCISRVLAILDPQP